MPETVKVDHTTTGLGEGKKTISTAGSPETLAGSVACKWITIEAYASNTAVVAIGGSSSLDASAAGNGITLEAKESYTVICDNLQDVYIDVLTDGEGVRYIYGK